jgi:U3 small nucleolar RNA-associated protein 4
MAVNPASTMLALGCEDGSIQIISLENDSLFLLRRLDRSKFRILSLAWGPSAPRNSKADIAAAASNNSESDDDDDDEWSDTWLVAGCSDSSLRKYDFVSGHISDRMITDRTHDESTLVWTVGVIGYD